MMLVIPTFGGEGQRQSSGASSWKPDWSTERVPGHNEILSQNKHSPSSPKNSALVYITLPFIKGESKFTYQ